MTMPSSTGYDPGTVVAVRIRFSDGEGVKRRPAVIMSGDDYHASRADAVVVALTTNMRGSYFGDCDLTDWQSAGLPRPSKAKGVIHTIEHAMIEREYGKLAASDLARVKDSIRRILEL